MSLDETIAEQAILEHTSNMRLGEAIKAVQEQLPDGMTLYMTSTQIELAVNDLGANFDIDDPHLELIGRTIHDAASLASRKL